MNITHKLMSLSVLAAGVVGVVAAAPTVSAQGKVCISRSLQMRDYREVGTTTYIYFEEVCDAWMDTTGPKDPTAPKDDGGAGGGGGGEPMTREEECDARARQLEDLERSLQWADTNVLALEAAVGRYDREETDAGRAEADAAAEALAADVALAEARTAYSDAGYDTTVTRIVNRREVEVEVGYDIGTPEGKAVVAAQAAQRAARAKLEAARRANGDSHSNGSVEGEARRNLDEARSILASYPMQIEQLRREYEERC